MEAVYASLVAAVAAIVSSLGTLWLQQRHAATMAKQQAEIDRKRYADDRVWDTQKDIYTSLLRKLNDAAQIAMFIDHGFHGEGANAHRFFESEAYRNADTRMRLCWYEAREIFETNHVFLTEHFNAKFLQRRETYEAVYGDDKPMCYREYKAVLTETLRLMTEIARKDIHSRTN